jgi:hypothetical protein
MNRKGSAARVNENGAIGTVHLECAATWQVGIERQHIAVDDALQETLTDDLLSFDSTPVVLKIKKYQTAFVELFAVRFRP